MTAHTVRLRDMAHGGDAVGDLDGKAVFVPYGIPGELVRVEVAREYARHVTAKLLEVLAPSPDRVEPPCPHFGACGGCQWQHIAYTRQLEYKQRIVRAQMERVAKLPSVQVLPVIGMEEPWAYRNHVQYGVTPDGRLGFLAQHSHSLVPIQECWIAHPWLEELAGAFDMEGADVSSLTLRIGANSGEKFILFEGKSEPEISVDFPVSCVYLAPAGDLHVLAGDSYYHERLNERLWQVSAPSFFQVNTVQAERLVQEASARLTDGSDTLIDAYCGVGTFALSLASRYKQVIGIEGSPWAVNDAEINRKGEQAEFLAGFAEELLANVLTSGCTVVLDPPRAGCAPEVLQALTAARVRQIVYVSCDPATLARDLGVLAQAGYRIGAVQPIDMFPQTGHVECVVSIENTP
ncbi:MAG: 23S rRNA (uracil(1939)-C(5))-methyltransferase RlmD [Chloroflexi bacterium]|nr:23S rRNA (uracil(1939)-C(5))-methyltransferase RlmD [Chloroflexota bacterium]